MNIAGRYLLLGALIGSVGGFLLGAGPLIIHHAFPLLAFRARSFYAWPLDVMVTGFSAAAMLLLPGACVGGMVGAVVRRTQRRQNQRPAQQPETDA